MYNKLVYKIDIIDIELSLLTVCVVQLIYTLNDYDVRDDDLCISRPLMMQTITLKPSIQIADK